MALPGQRFNLDLDSDNWKFDVQENTSQSPTPNVISNIQEREPTNVPPAPTLKSSKTGFPDHRPKKISAFKQRRQEQSQPAVNQGPSDRAILHHAAKKHGVDLASVKEKADIDAENRRRIQNMSIEELEDARSELMARFNPGTLRAFLARANVDDEHEKQQKEFNDHEAGRIPNPNAKSVSFAKPEPEPVKDDVDDAEDDTPFQPAPTTSSTHFPTPPRSKDDFKPLDPNSESFLDDLRETYFPDLPHNPESLSWLRDPTDQEAAQSAYNPDRAGFAPSALRFDFKGNLITPNAALEIPTSKGLHHHGDAPHSAGYTVPELALLARSTLANQRSIAYQVMGRLLYRLGRGDFGPRGGEMSEGLWTCIEKERIVEIIMAEANYEGKGAHQTAKTYATEALWLWRRGGGGDRGVLKDSERRAT